MSKLLTQGSGIPVEEHARVQLMLECQVGWEVFFDLQLCFQNVMWNTISQVDDGHRLLRDVQEHHSCGSLCCKTSWECRLKW